MLSVTMAIKEARVSIGIASERNKYWVLCGDTVALGDTHQPEKVQWRSLGELL
jgi:hypothetical protein